MGSKYYFVPCHSTPVINEDNIQKIEAKSSIAAAKKIYKEYKQLTQVAIYDKDTKEVFVYSTKYFFTKKKSFQRNR